METATDVLSLGRRIAKRITNRLLRHQPAEAGVERLMYRVHLFHELQAILDRRPQRILEIGPKDGLDSTRLASLEPDELVMIDLPEKRDMVDEWLVTIPCPHQYIEGNLMYMDTTALGTFDLIWCTGVLYHNPEQLRLLRKLFKLLNVGGLLVLESATIRDRRLRDGAYVQIYYPETYRDTGTITHLPSAGAIRAWLAMVGFTQIHESRSYQHENPELAGQRYACIARKTEVKEGTAYYAKTGLNPTYQIGDSV
jgi:SAM-dependent methyltransferase